MTRRSETAATRMELPSRVSGWLGMISGVVLIAMMFLICVGVAMRYLLNTPIAGSNEMLEMASVAFVMLALPYSTAIKAHIRIDMLDNLLGSAGVVLTELLYRGLGIVILGFLVRATIKRAGDAYAFEDATNMISIPLWPFYWLMALGFALFAMILLVQALELVVRIIGRHG